MMTTTENTDQYSRNRVLTTLMVVNTLLFVLCGLIYITSGKTLLSMLWFAGALLFYINFLWSKKTPFVQLNETGLTLIHAMARPKQMVNFLDIASVQRTSDFKAYLHLKNGERVKIALFFLNKEDRIPLLHRLEAVLKKSTAP